MSVQVGKLGILIKRRMLVQGLVIIVLGVASYYLFAFYYANPYQALLSKHIDHSIMWS